MIYDTAMFGLSLLGAAGALFGYAGGMPRVTAFGVGLLTGSAVVLLS